MTPAEYRLALPGGDELVARAGSVLVAVGENASGLDAVGRSVARHIAAGNRGAAVYGYVGRRRGLSPSMDVAENVFMGRERRGTGVFRFGIDWKRTRDDSESLLRSLGSSLSPGQRARDLGESDRLMVEFARVCAREAVLVVIDEPTALLDDQESVRVIEAVRALAERGIAVLVLSQKPRLALGYADEVAVVRDGAVVAVHARDAGSGEGQRRTVLRELVERPGLAWGRGGGGSPAAGSSPEMLRIDDWTVLDPVGGSHIVEAAGLVVGAGEIVGIAGLRDSGAEALLLNVYGTSEGVRTSGTVAVRGEPVDTTTVEKAIAAGLFLAAMDPPRYRVRFIGGVAMPVTASSVPRLAKLGLIDRDSDTEPSGGLGGKMMGAVRSLGRSGDEAAQISAYITAFPGSERLVLMLGNPTKGLASAARVEVHAGLRAIAAGGKSVVLTSDDLTELFDICDRVVTMAGGLITGTLNRPAPIDPAHLGALLAPN